MKNLSRHRGTLRIIARLPRSRNGNPRYLATVGGVTFRTAVDSNHGYVLPDYEGEEVVVILGTHYGQITLEQLGDL